MNTPRATNASARHLGDGRYEITFGDGEPEILVLPTHLSEGERREVLHRYVLSRLKQITDDEHERLRRGIEAIDTWSELKKLSQIENSDAQPPRFAELAFAWLAPKATVDAQLGDMQEIFIKNVEKSGLRRARWLYWLEILPAIGPAAYRLLKRSVFIGLIVDFVRAKFGF